MRLIRLVLQAPLQSWGERSRWDSRDTAAMPTKSALIGLLGCCLGIPRGDPELLELNRQLHVAVRADRPGRVMTDFHTVQAPKGQKILNSQGKGRGETILTPKQYLQDAQFTVFLWGDPGTMEECFLALRHPNWVPYLGRRNCVPSRPLVPEWIEAESIDAAISKGIPTGNSVLAEIECMPGDILREDEHEIKRPDSLINASLNEYRYRRIRATTLHGEE